MVTGCSYIFITTPTLHPLHLFITRSLLISVTRHTVITTRRATITTSLVAITRRLVAIAKCLLTGIPSVGISHLMPVFPVLAGVVIKHNYTHNYTPYLIVFQHYTQLV